MIMWLYLTFSRGYMVIDVACYMITLLNFFGQAKPLVSVVMKLVFIFFLLDIQSISGSAVMEESFSSLRSSRDSNKKIVSCCGLLVMLDIICSAKI